MRGRPDQRTGVAKVFHLIQRPAKQLGAGCHVAPAHPVLLQNHRLILSPRDIAPVLQEVGTKPTELSGSESPAVWVQMNRRHVRIIQVAQPIHPLVSVVEPSMGLARANVCPHTLIADCQEVVRIKCADERRHLRCPRTDRGTRGPAHRAIIPRGRAGFIGELVAEYGRILLVKDTRVRVAAVENPACQPFVLILEEVIRIERLERAPLVRVRRVDPFLHATQKIPVICKHYDCPNVALGGLEQHQIKPAKC